MKNKIFLVGPMGSGKSSTGRLLASKLNLPHFDLDSKIEKHENMTISSIFTKHSEEYFRNLESSMLQKLSREREFVMSTGGGCIMRDSNLSILRHGLVIYLRISIDEQYNRVKNRKHRPLLNTEDALTTLERLNNERGAIYADISDIQIDVSNLNKEEVLSKVVDLMK